MEAREVESAVFTGTNDEIMALFGSKDENIRTLERLTATRVINRNGEIVIEGLGEGVDKAYRVLKDLLSVVREGTPVSPRDVRYAFDLISSGGETTLSDLLSDVVQVTARGKQIRPRTVGQKRYVDAIRQNGITFGIGPAGTGKTYLAIAMAVAALKNKEVSRIVLSRPAVEAGEKLGFLPGDLQDKVDPYLRPLYDALFDILGVDTFERYRERGIIEVAPLAYMRGRTLDDSFIIMDEAQNTTHEQMKMFLTRLGFGSKAVVTGDITQIDLPRRKFSGLEVVQTILQGIEGIAFVYLTDKDVVRHHLVQKIVKAYERYDAARG